MDTTPDVCPSCGTERPGKFCINCGEKKIASSDLTLKKYLLQTVDAFTHFEGKFFTSFKYLLFYPGKLTKAYLEGRRVLYMKPPQLYVIVAIIFFFFFKSWDIFYNKSRIMLAEDYNAETGVSTPKDPSTIKEHRMYELATTKAAKKGQTLLEFTTALDEKLADRSKAWVVIIVPFLALLIYAVSFRKEQRAMPHLVHATHLFTFLQAFSILWIGAFIIIVRLFHVPGNYNYAFFPVGVTFIVYTFFSLRNVLGKANVLVTLGQCLFVAAGFVCSIVAYRTLITWISIWLA